jgi:hypothetical protein
MLSFWAQVSGRRVDLTFEIASFKFRHDGTMRLTTCIACLLLILSALRPLSARGDTVVLNSGETFDSAKVWQENGKIRFDLHGLVVSVDKDDVASIIRNDGSPSAPVVPQILQPATQEPPTPPANPTPEQPRTADRPENPPPLHEPRSAAPHSPERSNHAKRTAVQGTGLAGISWQMKPSDIAGLAKVKTEPEFGGIDQYVRPDQALALGRAPLDGMVYGFWRNRLYSITAWVDGRPGYERLKAEVMTRYGEGQANRKGLERYVWRDQTTDRLLEFDGSLNSGLFWMRSRRVDAQIKEHYPQ